MPCVHGTDHDTPMSMTQPSCLLISLFFGVRCEALLFELILTQTLSICAPTPILKATHTPPLLVHSYMPPSLMHGTTSPLLVHSYMPPSLMHGTTSPLLVHSYMPPSLMHGTTSPLLVHSYMPPLSVHSITPPSLMHGTTSPLLVHGTTSLLLCSLACRGRAAVPQPSRLPSVLDGGALAALA